MKNQFYSNVRTLSLLFFLILLAVLAFAGCGLIQSDDESESPSTFDGSIYYPMNPGVRWSFSDSSRGMPRGFNMTALRTETHSGELFNIVAFATYEDAPPWGVYGCLRFGHDTLYVLNPGYLIDSLNFTGPSIYPIMILNPSRIGDMIKHDDWPNDDFNSDWFSTTGVASSVQTPTGTYENCIYIDHYGHKVTDNVNQLISRLYFAPNIGPVLMIEYNHEEERDDSTWHWSLSDYEP